MAKFVLLNQGEAQPLQTYEGDKMNQNGEYVQIVEDREEYRIVAAIRLDKGQSVKQVGK